MRTIEYQTTYPNADEGSINASVYVPPGERVTVIELVPREFGGLLLASAQSLRAFAMVLSGRWDQADDLVQETLLKAWANYGSFQKGSNLRGWLFTILRNQYYSDFRRRRREVQDSESQYAGRLSTHAPQHGHLDLAHFKIALKQIPADQREALVLVGASCFSYEEAATICGVPSGTVKSRVGRARSQLAKLLSPELIPAPAKSASGPAQFRCAA
jgi:RNA polymerase sigma-70 factor (ECF subfamily)